MARRADYVVSHSTLSRALRYGESLPTYRTITAFLQAIRADEATTRRIRAAWLRAAEENDPVGLYPAELDAGDHNAGEDLEDGAIEPPTLELVKRQQTS